jgi:Uma2 family endonuclease
MSALTPTTRPITGEELARMPGGDSCELVAGRIVPVSPGGVEHSLVTASAFRVLDAFVRPRRLGLVLTGEVGFYTRRDPDTVRGADVAFVSTERYERRTRALVFLDVAPDLVVEVLSARDTVMDLTDKLHDYFAAGVRLVWVVDPRSRRVSAYRSVVDVREAGEADTLSGEDVLAGFTTPVAALFEP